LPWPYSSSARAGWKPGISPLELEAPDVGELEAPDVEECETPEWEDFEELDDELDEEEGEEELDEEVGAVRSSGLPLYSEQSSIT